MEEQTAQLGARLECQVDNNWRQMSAGTVVKILETAPHPLLVRDPDNQDKWMRQATRFPEDWEPTYAETFKDPVWVICFVPRLKARCQFRLQDLLT